MYFKRYKRNTVSFKKKIKFLSTIYLLISSINVVILKFVQTYS